MPEPGRKMEDTSKKQAIKVVMVDSEMSEAVTQADLNIQEARAAIGELEAKEIYTLDMEQALSNATARFYEPKCREELTGYNDSACYWANVVIEGCRARKSEH